MSTRQKTKKKTNKKAWFVRVRGSYLPTSNTGLVIYTVYVAYIVAVLVSWIMSGYNYLTFILFALPLLIAAALVTQYIASKHASR
ncbi:MAG TPA: hypothetical protein VLF43_05405 [Candidatus Saccharimonadales bacterium]|nr:hypothetical protein [Candidatus Saccharimonadales bacterium]